MKKIIALCIFLCAYGAVSTFAQDTTKVVVIPLNSTQKVIENDFNGSSLLTDSSTYIMSGTDVSLPKDGTCVVTATGSVSGLDAGDTVTGPYFRTAQQIGAGLPTQDPVYGGYALYVAGSASSTTVAATYAWDMAANTSYRFGCAFLARPSSWATEIGYCRVTWVCSAN
ncbi:hypothetical protein KKC22_20435 [Myxococcota bacterium]|nr:hypothetical protein [Myxococcota bacterium]